MFDIAKVYDNYGSLFEQLTDLPNRPWVPGGWSVVTDTDSYKVSMWKQYPMGTEMVSSYIEARGGEYPVTVFTGLQPLINRLKRHVTVEEVNFAAIYWAAHGEPFNYQGWMYIATELAGKLPLRIEAVPEGTVVPVKNALVQVVNTDPRCYWLTTWVETPMLRAVWFATTVATLSWSIKQMLINYLKLTTDDDNIASKLAFMLHDFGSRGTSSHESAEIGGAAHLMSFMGTDTAVSMIHAAVHYDALFNPIPDPETGLTLAPGYSIPAAEHSTITSWGREGEVDAFRNMLHQFGGAGKILAVVSDSYNIYEAAKMWGTVLKEEVENMGGTLVVRPDSGDPRTVPVEVIEILSEHFGYTINSKGYKVLPDCVRVIQGDGIEFASIAEILHNMETAGWSAENITFGMGGALLQKIDRDTQKWAMKCSAVLTHYSDDEWIDVFKDPITDSGKTSKKGRLALIMNDQGEMETVRKDDMGDRTNLMELAYFNGEVVRRQSFDDVRTRTMQLDHIRDRIPNVA